MQNFLDGLQPAGPGGGHDGGGFSYRGIAAMPFKYMDLRNK